MPEIQEPDERRIREYVQSQLRDPDDPVSLVQKIGTRRVAGRAHDLFDVRTAKGRWWEITDLTNLYSQDDFHSIEMAFTYHLGVCLMLAERQRTEIGDEEHEHVAGAWRRYTQAVDALDLAGEAEDFQAIGVVCREALLAFVRENVNEDWLTDLTERPKLASFKEWANIFAERLAQGRLRSYLKMLSEKCWDLSVALQHDANATLWDADLVVDATGYFLHTFSVAMVRAREGAPPRCPNCDSYRIRDDGEVVTVDGRATGWRAWTGCLGCGWRSEHGFTPWGGAAAELS